MEWIRLRVDTLGDPALRRAVRRGAKNLELLPWLILFAARENNGGRLTVNGQPAEPEDIAYDLPGVTPERVANAIEELLQIGALVKGRDQIPRFAEGSSAIADWPPVLSRRRMALLGDPLLRYAVRRGARNLELLPWLILFAARADDDGRLTINGQPVEPEDIAQDLPGVTPERIAKAIEELVQIGVLVGGENDIRRFAVGRVTTPNHSPRSPGFGNDLPPYETDWVDDVPF